MNWMALAVAVMVGLAALAGGGWCLLAGRRALAWSLLAVVPLAAGMAISVVRQPLTVPTVATATGAAAIEAAAWGGVGQSPGAAPSMGAAMPASAAAGGKPAAGSMEEMTARLAARLVREPNDAGGWMLLAQSYDYLGKTTEATAARARVKALGAPVSPALAPAAMAAHAKAGVVLGAALPQLPPQARLPSTANDWWARGIGQRRQRDFKGAAESFRRATVVAPASADAWADYADALAAANEGDLRKGAAALERALKLDPRHIKALWLRASLQLQVRDYAGAAKTWQAVLALVPPKSSDARIIRANLEEARALAEGKS